MTITASRQRHSPGELVTLFELDCTNFADGTVLYFTSSAYSSAPVQWNGNTYVPVDIEAEGFEYNGQSAFPNPTLRLSNVSHVASALVITYDDLIGATFRRIRTFSEFLDDGPEPDPLQVFPIDVYRVEQKTKHTRTMIEWKLSAAVDQQGIKVPSFQLVRDYCARIYRRYDPVREEFTYTKATCPYSDSNYFDSSNDSVVDAQDDVCSKTLAGCRARYGSGPLPFKGCPGLARFR